LFGSPLLETPPPIIPNEEQITKEQTIFTLEYLNKIDKAFSNVKDPNAVNIEDNLDEFEI